MTLPGTLRCTPTNNFAETLVRFGECAHMAAELVSGIRDEETQIHALTSIIKAMARFFWFTVEFGLMREPGALKAYGSGLLSSYGEIAHAIELPEMQRYPIQLEWARRAGKASVAPFHPELTSDSSVHRLFLEKVSG
jgi:phenylalanine-4-hydroxylase